MLCRFQIHEILIDDNFRGIHRIHIITQDIEQQRLEPSHTQVSANGGSSDGPCSIFSHRDVDISHLEIVDESGDWRLLRVEQNIDQIVFLQFPGIRILLNSAGEFIAVEILGEIIIGDILMEIALHIASTPMGKTDTMVTKTLSYNILYSAEHPSEDEQHVVGLTHRK